MEINRVSESSEDSWDGWDEPMDDKEVPCLFCESLFKNATNLFDHCKTDHGFNIAETKSRFALDCFNYIRMINYLRLQKPPPEDLRPFGVVTPECWQADEYMKPVVVDDPLLMFDIESCEEEELELDDETVMLPRSKYNELLQRLKQAEDKVARTEDNLKTALENVSRMKSAAQNYLMGNCNEDNIAFIKLEDDINYFGAYAHFSIHHDMLRDRVRTESYRDMINFNRKAFEDKVVLDVGCGTGILSMFAARAGAKSVIGIDQSEIIYQAMDIVRENKLEDKIQLLRGRMEETTLPVEKVDVIISEWMGYFLLFECMLDTVIQARDKYLKNNGLILPNKCTLSLVGISDVERHRNLVTFWDNVYGFKMTCLKHEVIREASVEITSANSVVTSTAVIKTLDLNTCSAGDAEFTSEFTLVVNTSSPIVAVVGYFDAFFDLEHAVHFSTSPFSPPTHWKQCVFYLEEPLHKQQGDELSGKLTCSRYSKDPRALSVTIVLESRTYAYVVQ